MGEFTHTLPGRHRPVSGPWVNGRVNTTFRHILRWDESLFLWVCRWQRPGVVRLMKGLTHFGDGTSWTLVALILISLGSVEAREAGLLLGWGAGLSALTAQVVKRISRRRRPDVGISGFKALVANPDAFSFPSGHTAAAFGVAVAVMGHTAGLGPLMAGLAAAIALSRVYLGAHYPLDVAVGALIGTASGAAAQHVVLHVL